MTEYIRCICRKPEFRIFLLSVVFIAALVLPVAAYTPAAVSAFNTGVNLTENGQYEKALLSFDQAISLEPKYFEAWNGKADVLNRLGRYNESLMAVDTGLGINPQFTQGWINRGAILYNLGRYDDELASYDKAIAIDPQSDVAWFNRAYSLAAMGRYDESLAAFAKVKELNPDYPYLQRNTDQAAALQKAEKSKEFSHWVNTIILPAAALIVIFAVVALWYMRLRKKKK